MSHLFVLFEVKQVWMCFFAVCIFPIYKLCICHFKFGDFFAVCICQIHKVWSCHFKFGDFKVVATWRFFSWSLLTRLENCSHLSSLFQTTFYATLPYKYQLCWYFWGNHFTESLDWWQLCSKISNIVWPRGGKLIYIWLWLSRQQFWQKHSTRKSVVPF